MAPTRHGANVAAATDNVGAASVLVRCYAFPVSPVVRVISAASIRRYALNAAPIVCTVIGAGVWVGRSSSTDLRRCDAGRTEQNRGDYCGSDLTSHTNLRLMLRLCNQSRLAPARWVSRLRLGHQCKGSSRIASSVFASRKSQKGYSAALNNWPSALAELWRNLGFRFDANAASARRAPVLSFA